MLNNSKISCCQITSRHHLGDERILYRMAKSLAHFGFQSSLIATFDKDNTKINGKSKKMHFILVKSNYTKNNLFLTLVYNLFVLISGAIKFRFHIIQFHDPDLIFFAPIFKLFGKKVIYDVHDDYEASILDRFLHKPFLGRLISKSWWFFEKNLSKVFDGIVVADRHLATKFQNMNPVVLGNYPRKDFTEGADTSLEKTFNLIYVGGVNWERGVSKILDALDLISHEDIRFHIIGDCQDKALQERIKSNTRVIWHGRVAWTELHKYYTQSHVGLAVYQPIPSFQYCPGENSVKIIEYMAAGIPTICSNFPGLKTFVEEAGYGLTVQPDNPEEISEKINYLYNHPELRKQLGQNGRNAFAMKYNWEQHEGKLLNLYYRILRLSPTNLSNLKSK